jgi:hypothetical protein
MERAEGPSLFSLRHDATSPSYKVYAESISLIPLQNQKLALKVVIATILLKLFPKPEPFA